MNASSSSIQFAFARHSRVFRLFATVCFVACLSAANPARAIGAILAATTDFTTVNGTVNANGAISGLPIAATTLFDQAFLDLPITNPSDPLGTARHELFHGIGFAKSYNTFFSHTYAPTSGPLVGFSVFNTGTNTLGSDMLVLTSDRSHDVPADFTGLGNGGSLIDQTNFLMTPGPKPGAPIPYPIDARDISALNIAYNWTGTGGIKINVVFDNTYATWTAAEKALINQARDNVQDAFGPNVGTTNIFTWTVQVYSLAVPEPSTLVLSVVGFAGLGVVVLRKKKHFE